MFLASNHRFSVDFVIKTHIIGKKKGVIYDGFLLAEFCSRRVFQRALV